jgi:hypothetical protein
MIHRLTPPPDVNTALLAGLVTQLGGIAVIGDLVEILTGIEDGDYTDIGTWVTGLLGEGDVDDRIAEALHVLATAMDMVPIVGSTLSDILDNIANGINDVNGIAIAAAATASAAHTWASFFYDDFNRANGAPANGWTALGTEAQIVSNRLDMTGATDKSSAVIRDSGTATGKMRVEGTIRSPSVFADCGLQVCTNAAGTQGVSANFFANKVFISRFSTSLNGNPTFTDLGPGNTSLGGDITDGEVMSLSIRNGTAWIERGGASIYSATDANVVVPATNQYAGARVERAPFSQVSGKWDDVRILL